MKNARATDRPSDFAKMVSEFGTGEYKVLSDLIDEHVEIGEGNISNNRMVSRLDLESIIELSKKYEGKIETECPYFHPNAGGGKPGIRVKAPVYKDPSEGIDCPSKIHWCKYPDTGFNCGETNAPLANGYEGLLYRCSISHCKLDLERGCVPEDPNRPLPPARPTYEDLCKDVGGKIVERACQCPNGKFIYPVTTKCND